MIDGVPDTYDVEWGLARNWTLDTIIAERYRIKRVLDVARAFSVVGVPYLLLGNGNYGAWSALVASLYHQPRYWDAQYSDYLPGIESGLNVSLYNSQRPRLDVPVRVLGARANHTCHFLNITGPECTEQELTGPVTWRLQEETAALSTVSGKARRCSVPGCNHAVVWEHPAYVADLLWGWVKDWPVRN